MQVENTFSNKEQKAEHVAREVARDLIKLNATYSSEIQNLPTTPRVVDRVKMNSKRTTKGHSTMLATL